MTDLILTEKFSVARDFAKALGAGTKDNGFFEGSGVTVTWAVGHLVELYEPQDYDPALKTWRLGDLPVIPDRFQYKPVRQTVSQFRIIRNLLRQKKFARVILATDAGREGEVIARTILLESGFTEKLKVYRFWTSQALVPEVVRSTMAQVRPMADYDRLWRAGYYRQVSDWLIGMNCTRVLTIRLKDLFSVGRVQTAVLALLVDRKIERENFVPQPYWILTAKFSNTKGTWTGHWFKEKQHQLLDREQAHDLYHRLNRQGIEGHVKSVRQDKKKEAPPLLFSLTDLQQAANQRFGFAASRTLDIAQKLYQDFKCLSYPRTDARVLGSQNLDMVQRIVQRLAQVYKEMFDGVDANRISLSNKRVFNDKKLTDHHALIPLKPVPDRAGPDERNIYNLVLCRFAAAFYPDCRFEVTRVVTLIEDETFETRGRVILDPGWQRVWTPVNKKQDQDTGMDLIPALVPGDPAATERLALEEKQTRPPGEYTDASLLKDMTNPGRYVQGEAEKKLFRGEVGIGTQSTRAQIIETLIRRQYICRSGKQLLAQDKGVFLVQALRKCTVSSVLTSPEETARWEMGLNQIALGEQGDLRFLEQIKAFTASAVKELACYDFGGYDFCGSGFKKAPGPALGRCPGCGGQVVDTPKAYACENTSCNFVIWKRMAKKSISPKMAANLLTFRRSGPFTGFISKKKQRFSASLAIVKEQDTYKVAFSFESKTDGQDRPAKKPGGCPLCGGPVIEGHTAYGCGNFRPEHGACRFVIPKKIWGKTLTLANAKDLACGKTTRSYVFKDGEGQKFKAKLKLVKTSDNMPCIEMVPDAEIKVKTDISGLIRCTRPG